MNPFRDPRHERVEARLRAGASSFGPAPSPELRGRILSALREAPSPAIAPHPRAPSREREGTWLAAAAALLVLGGAWWLTRRPEARPRQAPAALALSRELLDAGTRVLALPAAAEGNLRLEGERLLIDTTRVAEGIVRGLPGPLRARLERM